MPIKHGLTVFFVPHNRKGTFSIKLSKWQVIIGGIVLGMAFVLIILGIFFGGKSTRLIAENRTLKLENQRLKNQRVKIAHLEREITRTGRMREWMEEMIGITGKTDSPNLAGASTGEFPKIIEIPFRPKLVPEFDDAAKDYLLRLEFIPRGLPVDGALTAGFGEMSGKFLSPHTGVDIAAPNGTVVKATASGLIVSIDNDPQLGQVITIDHLNRYKTRYGHLNTVNRSEDDRVNRGDVIGTVGETGHVTGPHVHYELTLDGEPIDPLEPPEQKKDG